MKTLIIDLDGTICSEEPTFERSLARPKDGVKEALKQLKSMGWEIVIHTARGWQEHRMTVDWLMRYNIPYDNLVMGKPIATYLVDDRAIKFESWQQVLLEANRPEEDIWALYNVRQATYQFIQHITKYGIEKLKVCVELGPMHKETMPFPEFYIDPTLYAEKWYGCGPSTSIPDFFQVLNYDPQPTDILAVNVLEHMEKVWDFPSHAAQVLKGRGKVHLFVPYSLRFHGPAPDLWRFTDTGLKHLMKNYKCTYLKNYGKDNKPYGIGATFEL